jgi:hypothetical protein
MNLNGFFSFGGERGIRTPGGVTLNGFQDRRIRPLCHLSKNKRFLKRTAKIYFLAVMSSGC